MAQQFDLNGGTSAEQSPVDLIALEMHRCAVIMLPGCQHYSAMISPEPPISAGKSFNFGSPSRKGSTVSA
jgi:hypothetical protein